MSSADPSAPSPTKTNPRGNVLRAVGGAFKAAFDNLTVTIPVALLMGFVAAGADMALFQQLGGGNTSDQSVLIKVILAWTAVALVQEILLGPLVGAIAVYIGRLHSAGQTASPYQALNFALGRYGRLFLPRLIAQLSIQIGLVLLLFPGIVYVSMYAFVDAVACLEQKVWPLDRSKALTRGRRGSIVLIYLPVAIAMQGVALIELWALQQGLVVLGLVFSAVYLVFFLINIAFYKLYESRTLALNEAARARAGDVAAPSASS